MRPETFNRRLPELVPKALCHTADNFVLVQEQHCFAAVTCFLPTCQKSFHLAGGEAFDFYFAELVWIVVENVGGCIAKSFHNAFGNLLPHARELSARQVFKDIVIVCGDVFKRIQKKSPGIASRISDANPSRLLQRLFRQVAKREKYP